jgi:predicted phage terminase large subunit-like protein
MSADPRPIDSSIAEQLASLDREERAEALASLSEAEARTVVGDWGFWARENQKTPPGNWTIWIVMAGRAWGKTRTGAEDMAAFALAHPDSRLALVAPNSDLGRSVMVEGESGLLKILPPSALLKGSVKDAWSRSLGELTLANGARFKIYSAEAPDSLRGPQHDRAWCDEFASFGSEDAFHNLILGLRLGDCPQLVITTTPRPTRQMRELFARSKTDEGVILTRGTTYDNVKNLPKIFRTQMIPEYAGTTIGRQELMGELLADYPGAYFSRGCIERARVTDAPDLRRIVVALDPAATSKPDSDLTGIVVAAKGEDEGFYVLTSEAMRAKPARWAKEVISLYDRHRADAIVAEVNQGGEMVTHTLEQVRRNLPVRTVHASRGKALRAEPVAALYERGIVHHVGMHPDLEDGLCGFPVSNEPDDLVDALVYAITYLIDDVPAAEASIDPPSRLGRSPLFPRPEGSIWDRVSPYGNGCGTSDQYGNVTWY